MSQENNAQSLNADPMMAFFRNIDIIQQLTRTRIENALPNKMKSSQFIVLCHLVRVAKKESPAELAKIFQVTRPTMTNTIQKLAAKNFITIEADPNDGRGKFVVLTEDGKQAQARAIQAVAPLFSDVINTLGVETFANTLPNLDKIKDFMNAHRN